MIIAKQSTARTVTVGPVLDADGVAVTDGVVADFKISKNGGAPAALNGSATLTHRNTGHYSLALTASDLDTVGQAEVVIDDTVNACPMKEITVVEEAVYDALFAASAPGYVANAPVNVAQISGDATAADNLESYTDGTTPMPVNATQISGDATAADNAEAFFDGTGYAGTNNVIPTVTTVNGLAANVVTAASLAADAGTEIGTAVWATAARTLTAATNLTSTGGTVTLDASGRVDVGALLGTALAASVPDNFNQFWHNGGIGSAEFTLSHWANHFDAIVADTNELQTDWTNGGRLDLLLDAVKAQTDKLTFNGSNHLYADLRSLWGSATITSSDRAPNL
jgi:hypothetical protein